MSALQASRSGAVHPAFAPSARRSRRFPRPPDRYEFERGIEKTTGRVREYLDVELVNVPADEPSEGGPADPDPPTHDGGVD